MANYKDREIDDAAFDRIVDGTRDNLMAYLHGHYNVALNESEIMLLDDTLVELLRTFFVLNYRP